MAIRVGYFQNTKDCYSEGPFVMVNANGWRIEVGCAEMHCPTLPDNSVYAFLRDRGLPDYKTDDEALCECVVDYLNAKVKDGTLVRRDNNWLWEIYDACPIHLRDNHFRKR
jgi:hypothetical protein